MVTRFFKDESGATMVEYSIMVVLIAALSVLVVKSLGSKVSNAYSSVNAKMP